MNVDYTVKLPCTKESFVAKYVKGEGLQTDTKIEYYDKYKISIVLTDGLAAVINGKVINTGKNGILFFRPDEIHFGRFLKEGVYSYIDFYIPKNYFIEMLGSVQLLGFLSDTSADRVNYIVPAENDKTKLLDIIQMTIDAIVNKNDAELLICMLNTVDLCGRLYEYQKKNPIKNNVHPVVSSTLLYISENYDNKITLKQLAGNADCSVAYLSRIFKEHTGKTIYNHIINIRIKKAQLLLRDGYNVTEACYLCGFDDCSNFISTFKKIVGKTPNEWRR